MKKRILMVACVLLLIALFLPFRREVNMTIPCKVLDQQDENFRGSTTVTFSGTYTDWLLFQDSFTGRLHSPDYPLMADNALDTKLLVGELDELLSYYVNGAMAVEIHYLASAWLEEDLDRFFIWVHVPDEKVAGASHGRYFLCPPDMTFEDIYAALSGR